MPTKKLRETFTLRAEDLIQMLHAQWVQGYVTAVCEDQILPDEVVHIPMDKGGPETEAWIHELADELNTMRRRADGTFYMPRKKPNVAVSSGDAVKPEQTEGGRSPSA